MGSPPHLIKRLAWLLCLLLACTVLGPVAHAHQSYSRHGTALDPVILQLKWKHQFQFAGYYAAREQGFYEEAGLDVQILPAPSTVEPAEVVLQGKADFGIASSDLVLLRSQGHPVVALAAIFQHSPLVYLTLRRSGIESVHQLAGKRVMLEAHATELLAYLQSEGISTAGITFLPHTFEPFDLLGGRVEAISAYATDEPFLIQAAGEKYNVFTPRSSGIDFYGDTLFTTKQQIKEHPQRVQAFLDASLKGWDYALDHPQEMIDLIYTQYSQRHSREHLAFEAAKTEPLILPDVVEIGYMNSGRWQHIADTYATMGLAPGNISLDGFLYDRYPNPNLTWIYGALLTTLIVLGGISAIAARFYKLNMVIRQEMLEKEAITEHLRTLEQRYRILVENAPFAIVISRLSDGCTLYVNSKAAQKFDITPDHAVGKSVLDYYVNPADRQGLLSAIDCHGYVQNFEVLLHSTTGDQFWVSLSATLITFGNDPAMFVSLVDVTERKALQMQLEQMAMTDELTGLFNRRYFTGKGAEEFERAKRYNLPLSIMMLDVDHFKGINDSYGHQVGDQVLKEFATLMQHNLRQVDISGRLGGEEFGVLLPNTTGDQALVLAERLRQTIASHTFVIAHHCLSISTSVGVVEMEAYSADLDAMLNQADKALYQAKREGRNRVVAFNRAVFD